MHVQRTHYKVVVVGSNAPMSCKPGSLVGFCTDQIELAECAVSGLPIRKCGGVNWK